MNQKAQTEYRACVEELLFSSQMQHTRSIRHHPGMSCYGHNVPMSYVTQCLTDRWRTDVCTAAQAGLLHDLYFYDPRTLPSYRQCFTHLAVAAESTAALRDGLTVRKKSRILARIQPLSHRMPRNHETAVVCSANRLCTTAETMQIWRNLSLRRTALGGT